MTYPERRQHRAARLREWAAGRAAKSDAAFAGAHEISAQIPFGQPVLVSHHSEGQRLQHLAPGHPRRAPRLPPTSRRLPRSPGRPPTAPPPPTTRSAAASRR
jgi:hypothetical protein